MYQIVVFETIAELEKRLSEARATGDKVIVCSKTFQKYELELYKHLLRADVTFVTNISVATLIKTLLD
jgi:hypothetical protein